MYTPFLIPVLLDSTRLWQTSYEILFEFIDKSLLGLIRYTLPHTCVRMSIVLLPLPLMVKHILFNYFSGPLSYMTLYIWYYSVVSISIVVAMAYAHGHTILSFYWLLQ